MSVVLTFRCDHTAAGGGAHARCPWLDDSFSHRDAGAGDVAAAIATLVERGWSYAGGELLCPDHHPARDPNPITEISVNIPPKVKAP